MKSKTLVIPIIASSVLLGSMLAIMPVNAQWLPFLYVDPGYINPQPPQFSNIESAVQYAINNAPPAPKRITVYPGVYPEHVVIPSSLSGITIEAKGSPPAILEGSQINATGFEIFGANHVTIDGFTVQNYTFAGIYVHPSSSAAFLNTIKKNLIMTNCGHGIAIARSDSNLIEGNTVLSNRMHGVFIQSGFKNKIRPNNAILWNAWRGIELENAPGTIVQSNKVMHNLWDGLGADSSSSGCAVKANTFSTNERSGMLVYSASNNIVNNVVNFNNGAGLMILDGSYNTVQGNQFNGNGFAGVFVVPMISVANFNTILNNVANINGYYGIFVGGDSNMIEGNNADWNGYVGIVIQGGMAFPMMNKALNNAVLNNTANFNGGGGRGQGMMIVRADYTLVDLNQLNSNVQQGIYMLNAMFNTVEHNQISSNGETGIFLEIAANNIIRWNSVYNNGGDGILFWRFSSHNLIQSNGFNSNTGSGIEIQGPVWAYWEASVYNNITDNSVYYNGLEGLYADPYSDYTTIHVNSFNNNSWNGIHVQSDFNDITNNYASGNGLDGILIEQGDNNNVETNQVNWNGAYGIMVTVLFGDTADWNAILNNTVKYNALSGIILVSGDYSIVQWNDASWNGQHGIALMSFGPWLADNNCFNWNTALNNDDNYYTGLWFDLYWDQLGVGNLWTMTGFNTNIYGTSSPTPLP